MEDVRMSRDDAGTNSGSIAKIEGSPNGGLILSYGGYSILANPDGNFNVVSSNFSRPGDIYKVYTLAEAMKKSIRHRSSRRAKGQREGYVVDGRGF